MRSCSFDEAKIFRDLIQKPGKAILAVSNLRRAIQTILVVMNRQLFKPNGDISVINIVSALQEMEAGGDAISGLGAFDAPNLAGGDYKLWGRIEDSVENIGVYSKLIERANYGGNYFYEMNLKNIQYFE